MQESRQTFHHNQNGQSEQTPGAEDEEENNCTRVGSLFKAHGQYHVPQHFR